MDLLRSSTARRVLRGLPSTSLVLRNIPPNVSLNEGKTVRLIILISLKHEASVCLRAGRDAGAKTDTVSLSQYFLQPYTVWSIPISPSILNIPWIIDDSSTNTQTLNQIYTHTRTHWFRILCVCVQISEYVSYHVLLPSTPTHTHINIHNRWS